MNTTPGTWIVEPATEQSPDGVFLHKIISVGPNGNTLVALVPNIADAALMATSPEMMQALIDFNDWLNRSKQPISIPAMNTRLSIINEKIASESGER
jgi:hypothetical protein